MKVTQHGVIQVTGLEKVSKIPSPSFESGLVPDLSLECLRWSVPWPRHHQVGKERPRALDTFSDGS